MTSELWQRVQEILERALALEPKDRSAFLEEACGDDPELRREVESLLETAGDAEGFIEEPLLSLRPQDDRTDAGGSRRGGIEPRPAHTSSGLIRVGDRVGPYRILRELGRGGMGKVLLARRDDDEFERVVAIKLLKRDMDSDEIVRRFRHERQILANLAHPNIAELFDGGTTAEGLPYFVMEYVEGVRIDNYCDDHKLSIRARLELFRKVCSAVHFAHQSLVVHRDLKPGNILVTEEGEPKLLDFGIAKLLATGVSNTEITTDQLTVPGIDPMTPDFASPEQVKGEAITTASDVYSLGVLLYQLLTGRRPYRLENHSVARLFKAIAEQEPTKPSAAVMAAETGTGDEPTAREISSDRSIEPYAQHRQLTGDLDAIVLKALRKEHRERYSSAEQLSDDIDRHLRGLPVAARQGTFWYQTSKFLRRNALAVAAAAAVFLTIVFGVRSMILANQAAREKQVAQSLSALFQFLLKLEPGAALDPDFATDLHQMVNRNVADLELARILSDQGHLLEKQGGFATAEVLYREALDMAIRLVGKTHADVAVFMNNLAAALEAQGEYAEAEKLFREALDIRIAVHGRESDITAITLNNLGAILQNKGDLAAAEPYLRESLEIRRRLFDADAPKVALAINNLAFFHQARGDFTAAETGYRQALKIFRTRFGLEHPNVGVVTKNLASLLTELGDHENAEKRAREALEILGKAFKHWRIADAESVVGGALAARGRYDDAEPLLRDSYTVLKTAKGPSARQTKEALERLEALEEARLKDGR